MKPLCFVLMPFGRKVDQAGRMMDFDAVYHRLIAKAVSIADLDPIRADEEQVGGTIHKPMFERLVLCDYAVADLTGANANVYYELGVRHATKPRSTVVVFAQGTVLPFDVAPLRGIPYQIDATGVPIDPERQAAEIGGHLRAARMNAHDDSPVFQLLDHMPRVEVDHTRTDIFRERVEYSRQYKERLAQARHAGADAVRQIAAEPALANLLDVEAGIIVDLYLSLRAVKAHEDMVALYARMPIEIQRTRLVQEQLAFALNRLGRSEEAEQVLKHVLANFGSSSETNGLLGRVLKDRWEAARQAGRRLEARGLLKRAIETYRAGFEADWRDAYPGVNAVTLMEFEEPVNSERADLLPVVRYSALRRARNSGGYWDYATMLELAVLANQPDEAVEWAARALAVTAEAWQPETTAHNLRLIREAREARGESTGWILELETDLISAAPGSQS